MVPLWTHELTELAQKVEKCEIWKKSKGGLSSIFSKKMSKLFLAFFLQFSNLFFGAELEKTSFSTRGPFYLGEF